MQNRVDTKILVMWGMKSLLTAATMLLFVHTQAQRSVSWREKVDDVIEQTDSLSLKSQTTFYLVKYLKHDRCIKETWYYTLKEGKPVFFQLRYAIDTSEITETYYLNRNQLICMAEFEGPYQSKSDELNRGEIYFFNDDILRQYVVSGATGQSRSKLSRQNDCLIKFSQRLAELRANLR